MTRRKKFIPQKGKIYQIKDGGSYICLQSDDNTNALMQNVASKWTFIARGCAIYPDGTIDWDFSTSGYFA